jgi:O-antigen ligase
VIGRVLRRLLAIVPSAVLLVALVSPGTPLLARLLIVLVAGVTLFDPAIGLLTTAALAPLGAFGAALDGLVYFRITELILLSFIAAWLLRPDERPTAEGPTLPRYASLAAWFFAVLIASLSFALCRQLLRYEGSLQANLATIALHYFAYADPTGISDGARMIEGFALVGAAIELFRRKPRLAQLLPVALAISAIAAAATSVLLSFGVGPAQILAREAVIGYRFSAHVLDPNAAASHFVLVLCLALGLVMREGGRRRAFWCVTAAACVAGLWMSRSRSAEAAAGLVIPAAFVWAATTTWTRAKRLSLLGGIVAVLLVFGAVRAVQIEGDPTYTASGFRQQFVMSSFRVIGTHPYLGIGAGRYFRDSPNFLTPQLAWSYGSENAHNNFLEITTEAGIIGFFLYAAWFVGALRPPFRALARDPREWRLLGCTAGIVAFLGTCLMGHPLLVPEVAAVFFLQLGLAAALGGSSLLNASAKAAPYEERLSTPVVPWRAVAVVGTIAFAVLPAWTLEKPLVPVHLEEVDGMYYADGGIAEGVPFRWTRKFASLYAPATARVIELPLRSPVAAITKEPTLVEITSGGITLANVLVDDRWTSVTLGLPLPEPPLQFSRINLRSNRTARIADIMPGSNDQREVAVQVGDIRILHVSWEWVPKSGQAPDRP